MGAWDGDCESQQTHAETIHLWTDHTAMKTNYYKHMHMYHIRTPLTRQTLNNPLDSAHNTYISLCACMEDLFIFHKSTILQ